MTPSVRAGGCEVEVLRAGAGLTLLYLHGEDGLLFDGVLRERLAERFHVVAPAHPGWGVTGRPAHVTTIDDLAYVYLDLIGELDRPVLLVGVSVGAWIAAEVATKSTAGIAALALVSPVGVKLGGREERAFVDLYATAPDDLVGALYGEPARAPALSALDEAGLRQLAAAQEAVARFTWEPYMHNPKLRHRLARVDVPTLVVGGDHDRFVLEPGYLEAVAAQIGGPARVHVVAGSGHRVDEEAPDAVAGAIAAFADDVVGARPAQGGR
jgi:pimeloyl-ACP methyl ester carboxylesterase